MQPSCSVQSFYSQKVDDVRFKSPSTHSLFETVQLSYDEVYPRLTVNLAAIPIEILEKIIAQLTTEERLLSVKTIGQRFHDISYNVMSSELKDISSKIYSQLEDSKDELSSTAINVNVIKDIMFMMAQFSFLQILNAEYNLLTTIYLDKETYLPNTVITYQVNDNIKEFNYLLKFSEDKLLDWNMINVNETLDKIRKMNKKMYEMFFIKCWDIKQDRFGSLLIKILNCAMRSNYTVTVSHEKKPENIRAKCRISGHYEIKDMNFTVKAPSFLEADIERYDYLKILLLFISNSIRVENYHHVLQMRWDCLDLATSINEEQIIPEGWFDKKFPNVENIPIVTSEEIRNTPNGTCKVIRKLKKSGESISTTPNWLGMRFDFELWCQVLDAPSEFFKTEFLEEFYTLGGKTCETDGEYEKSMIEDEVEPYQFQLDFKLYVKAISQMNSRKVYVENCVWIKESTSDVQVTQGKQLLT